MYETDNVRNDEVVEFFVDSLIKNDIKLDFVMTEKSLAKCLTEIYSKRTSKRFILNESLVLYVLEKVDTLTLPSGNFRIATNDDMFYLPYWFADFVPACHLGDWSIEDGIQSAQKTIDRNQAYIWEDGFPRSVAASVRHTTDCMFIGKVYTPPNLRGKGYSTACVASLSQKLFDDGWKYCALYADCANPYSNKVYRSIGYKDIFYLDQYKII